MTNSPANNMEVKRRNRVSTLRCILACQRISQMELAHRLALSWPTVLQNVKELMELGLVREAGLYESTGGRKARAFAPIRDARLAVGLDVTRDHVSAVLVDLGGGLLRREEEHCPFSLDDGYMERLGAFVGRFAAEGGAEERILGVGVSLPGIVDSRRGLLADSHILGLRDVPLQRFSRYIPWPCRFLNDANAAGLAEDDQGEGDLVYLSLSDSVGGAILRNGALYMGNHLRAGEFGHNTLVPGGRRCYCGKDGCLDAYCSAKVLSGRAGGSLSAFFDGLREGRPELEAVWREYLKYLAVAVNNLHISFDCDVMMGGYVGAYLEEFGAPLRALLEERNTFGADASYLRICRCRQEASAMGAALTQVEAFIQGL